MCQLVLLANSFYPKVPTFIICIFDTLLIAKIFASSKNTNYLSMKICSESKSSTIQDDKFHCNVWSGTLVALSITVRDDLGSIPALDAIFSEALISLLSDNKLQSLFLQHYATCNIWCLLCQINLCINSYK